MRVHYTCLWTGGESPPHGGPCTFYTGCGCVNSLIQRRECVPLDIKNLCFPMLLRDSGDMVYNQPLTGLEDSPRLAGRAFLTIVHAHFTRRVCECGGCGALMFSHAPEGPGEHGSRRSLRTIFSMHTLHEVSVCECALSKLRPRLLHSYNRMGGSGDAVDVSQKPVRDGVVGRCCWTTGRLYIEAPLTVPKSPVEGV